MAAYYVVTTKQLVFSTVTIAIFVAISSLFLSTFIAYRDLPEVLVGEDGKCIRVVNFRNGDGYTCQDQDVVLRKYKTVHAK